MPSDDTEQIRQAFMVIDKDGSGKISSVELKAVLRSLGDKTSDADIEEIIREIDLNGDGEVDYEGKRTAGDGVFSVSTYASDWLDGAL